jgi:NADP-dependent 3-hydroxy acid dehydrogenase YdfG
MNDIPYRSALVIGAGTGISASVTRFLRAANIPVVVAARNIDKLAPLVTQTGAIAPRSNGFSRKPRHGSARRRS